MSITLRSLPVVQNWDCHTCGSCCYEYRVAVNPAERQRLIEQGWDTDPEIGALPLFRKSGPWWKRHYELTKLGDGRCVFLRDNGRCRIHERFGSEAKPLACQIFPYVLVPAGDHFRVSLRFACPSAAGSKGRSVATHTEEIRHYTSQWLKQKGLSGPDIPPPRLQGRQRVDWPDLLRFVEALVALMKDRRYPVERRWRHCLALARLCRMARFDKVKGERLDEFLEMLRQALPAEVPGDVQRVPAPTWQGRLLFRQAAALYTRQDHGTLRGPAERSLSNLLGAALAFLRGTGPVPRLHARLEELTFEELEKPAGPLPEEAEAALERYYTIKLDSVQFCGPTNFGIPFWEGLQALGLTLPVILWVMRAIKKVSRPEAVLQAIEMVDNQFGYNPILGTQRQRLGLRVLAQGVDLERLIAWYSR